MARIGLMRERVTVQQEQHASDGGGGYALSWVDVATVWARVRPLSGREQSARGGQEASQMYEVTIRRIAVLTPDMRLLWGSTQLNILTAPNIDERGEFLTINCESGVKT